MTNLRHCTLQLHDLLQRARFPKLPAHRETICGDVLAQVYSNTQIIRGWTAQEPGDVNFSTPTVL